MNAHASCRVAAALVAAIVAAPLQAHAAGITRWATNGVPLCTAAGNQQNPRIVADGAGGAIVTWQDRRGTSLDDIYAQRVRADGTLAPGWPAQGVALCTAAFNQTNPQVASDGAGGAIVVWQDGRQGGGDIFAQRVLAGGAVDPGWPAGGVDLCAAAGAQGLPQIVPDGAGGAIVTWQDPRNGTSDIYAQHVLGDGSVGPGWPVDGLAVCVAIRTQSGPLIVTDGAGGAFITWLDSRNSSPNFDIYDIYAQRVLATGVVAAGWPANGVGLCTNVGMQLAPQIAADGTGGAIVTWFDRRYGQPIDPILQDIFAQRVSGAGVPQWTADGVALCTAVSTQADPVIVADGAGGAIVAWEDHRGASFDIYAQRVLAAGVVDPGWPVNGVALCATPPSQENPQIVPDGAGGAIVTWYNVISGAPFSSDYQDIYAQRVLGNGTIAPGWPAPGLVICAADSTQQNPQIAPDGAGGAIVTWQDLRSRVNNDIYAQRANDDPCAAPSTAGQSCGVVDWTHASGGRFSDIANWNGGAGPVPDGRCPATCLPYDARFGIGGAAYGVDFTGSATSATVAVDAGDHPAFHLAGSTYGMYELRVDGAGSGLTISGGTVAVEGAIRIGQAEGSRLIGGGARPAGTAGGPSSFLVIGGPSAKLTGNGLSDGIVFEPGGVLISAAAIASDLTNSGTLSPGTGVGDVGWLESSAGYTQSAGATLVVDLGGDAPGTGYDALRIAGPATLGGRLEWKLVGGYLPAVGKEFEVLVAHPRIGTFDSVAEDIGVSYTDTSVVLTATPSTPVLASLVSAEAEPGRVRVRWWVSGVGGEVTIQRVRGPGAWEPVAALYPDGTGNVRYEDPDVAPGRYGYRLALRSGDGEIAAGEVWVDVPVASRFGLAGVRPNPARGPLTVWFSLADAAPAALELFDLAGRRVESSTIESPRPGNRVLTLGAGRAPEAGVYLLQLSQGARRATCRVAVVR